MLRMPDMQIRWFSLRIHEAVYQVLNMEASHADPRWGQLLAMLCHVNSRHRHQRRREGCPRRTHSQVRNYAHRGAECKLGAKGRRHCRSDKLGCHFGPFSPHQEW